MRKVNNLVFHELHQKSRLSIKEVNEVLKAYGLYSSQYSILFCLKRFGSMTQTEIWQYLNVEAPTVTRTLTRLEKSGWIVRKAGSDKRERIVYLSPQAKKKLPEIQQEIERLEENLLIALSDSEQDQLISLLKKICKSTEKGEMNDEPAGANLD